MDTPLVHIELKLECQSRIYLPWYSLPNAYEKRAGMSVGGEKGGLSGNIRWVHPHIALEQYSPKRNALLFVAPFLSTLQIRDFGPYGLKILLGSIGTSFSAKIFCAYDRLYHFTDVEIHSNQNIWLGTFL